MGTGSWQLPRHWEKGWDPRGVPRRDGSELSVILSLDASFPGFCSHCLLLSHSPAFFSYPISHQVLAEASPVTLRSLGSKVVEVEPEF